MPSCTHLFLLIALGGGPTTIYSPPKTWMSYQLFLGDNPRARAGSSASHKARTKMEGHAGRFPSLSRHTWTHRPTMATIIQEMKNQPPPPTTSNPPPSCIPDVPRRPEICLRLIGGWVGVVQAFRRQYTLLVRNILLKAHRRLVHRAPTITSQVLAYNCTFPSAKLQQNAKKAAL